MLKFFGWTQAAGAWIENEEALVEIQRAIVV